MKRISLALLLVLAPFTIAACSKDKKDDGDAAADAAAAEAAAPAAVADAAPEAAVAVLDAAVAPIGVAATVAPKAVAKPVPKVDPPICAKARVARGRNSPAAPGLEQQCRAEGGTP